MARWLATLRPAEGKRPRVHMLRATRSEAIAAAWARWQREYADVVPGDMHVTYQGTREPLGEGIVPVEEYHT